MIGDVSIGKYSIEKRKNPIKQEKASFNTSAMEEISVQELGAGICGSSRMTPNIKKIIAPIIDTAYDLQDSEFSVNHKSVPSSSSDLWQTSVCVNVLKRKCYTEKYCTCIVIKTPNQELQQKLSQYNFVFKMKNKHNVAIRMTTGTTFIFSGKLLTHM